ncbi:unnamed protein product [Effrenium voratum]|uniref:Transmembrane protein n=1 Tax=Effrenium voratum TaxID=2562239 RepID=A0AA36JRK9_9DINO|nr:unnamed protein product [Effrenium voratum]CAJ1410459.1 unnamed protein product [Effrenium voratum]
MSNGLQGRSSEPLNERESREEATCWRSLLCWFGFFIPVGFELWVHLLHGFDRQEILGEEDALPKQLRGFLDFAELICRVCLGQVLVFSAWQLARAVFHCKVGVLMGQICEASPLVRQWLPALLLTLFTFGVGVWGCFVGDEGLPLWALRYSHICDMFCHAVVASALMGLGFDLTSEAHQGRLLDFLVKFFLCLDTIEGHGVHSEDAEPEFGDQVAFSFCDQSQHQSHARVRWAFNVCRICSMWASFLFMFFAYTFTVYIPESAPPWVDVTVDFIGRFCWAGISWWLMVSILACAASRPAGAGTSHSFTCQPATFDVLQACRPRGSFGQQDHQDQPTQDHGEQTLAAPQQQASELREVLPPA